MNKYVLQGYVSRDASFIIKQRRTVRTGGRWNMRPPVTFSYIFFFLKKADGFYVYIFFSLASKSYYVYATVNYLSGQLNFKQHPFGVL